MRKLHQPMFALIQCCLSIPLFSQVIHYQPASSFVTTCLYSNSMVNALAARQNPATLVKLHSVSASVYGEKRFGLKELGYSQLAVSIPVNNGAIGFDGDYFGGPSYNETGFGLSYARSLGKAFNLGIRFNYYQVTLQGYGNTVATGFGIGGEYHLTQNLNFAFSADNPVGRKFSRQVNEKTASVFRAGIGYEPSAELYAQIELIKEEDRDPGLRMQLRYAFNSAIAVDAGFLTLPASPFGGIGYSIHGLRLSLITGYQRQLGFTPGLLLIYSFIKKEN